MDSTTGSACCSIVFKDIEFLPTIWQEQLLVLATGAPRMLVDRIDSGGHVGTAFRQHIQQRGKGSEYKTVSIAKHVNTQASYSPSECGSILSIDFDCMLRNIEQSTPTHFALLLEQNNLCFVSKETVVVENESWTPVSLYGLTGKDFVRVTKGDEANDGYEDARPDFSILAGDIRLGYVTTCTTSQVQDESVSGIDMWRVTIYHENATADQHNTRVMQLEHNTNVLLQELSDMHEHADITRREHASQLAGLHNIQEELVHERTICAQLRRELTAVRTALDEAETETRAAHSETEQLQDLVASMENEASESDLKGDILQLQCSLHDEKDRYSTLVQSLAEKEAELTKQSEELQRREREIIRLKIDLVAASDLVKSLKLNKDDLSSEVEILKSSVEQLALSNTDVKRTLENTKKNNAALDELLALEKTKFESINMELKELRALYVQMEADIARERELRMHLELSHQDEISRVEETARVQIALAEEHAHNEKMDFLRRESQLLEEKRNLATSLQAATTKSALMEQRLSNQLLSVSELHKSEVARVAHLEEELKFERETRSLLEDCNSSNEEEGWEVVEDDDSAQPIARVF